MELFVVNRHEGSQNVSKDDEQEKLAKLQAKIERNRQKRIRAKERQQEYIQREQLKGNTVSKKHKKKEKEIITTKNNETEELSIENEKKKLKLDESALEGFTILGTDKFDKKEKVKRVLPKWLLHPTIISVNLQDLQIKISDIKEIDKDLKKLLKLNGVHHFFPVQATVIPWLIEANRHKPVVIPRDICVSAPTGSGKTLAFVLPVVQILKRHTIKRIRALVILPTQDLANQVYRTFRQYSHNTNLESFLLTGSNSAFANEQKQLVSENEAFGLVSKVDILVCTAGRLVDHLKSTKGFNLQYLEFLIIDEADRVLDTVQNDWLYHLENHIYHEETSAHTGKILNLLSLEKRKPPQKLLFSATLSQDPEKLQKLSLFQPKLFTSVVENSKSTDEDVNLDTFIGKYTTPKELTEKYIVTTLDLKPLVLYKFIKMEKLRRTLIFTHSVESAHRLMLLLKSLFKDELTIQEISSHLKMQSRNDLISKFSKGKIDLLVCTDSLARGIDLPDVQCVISYSAPKHLKTYIHRAGRTARAGENGVAVTLLHKTQLANFQSMLVQADKTNIVETLISEEDLETLVSQYKDSLQQLKEIVKKEEKEDIQKTKSAKKK